MAGKRFSAEQIIIKLRAGSPWENGYVESFNGKLRDDSGLS